MRKFVSLLGVFAVLGIYVASAMASPVPVIYTAAPAGCSAGPAAGNCGESNLVSSTLGDPDVHPKFDWMVLDLSIGTPYRMAWETLVTNGAYLPAGIPGDGVLPTLAALPATAFAYLYQAEDPTSNTFAHATVLFGNTPSVLAAGALVSTGLKPVPMALWPTLNFADQFPTPGGYVPPVCVPPAPTEGQPVDDLDRGTDICGTGASAYHPAHFLPPVVAGTPASNGGPGESEGPRPVDGACPAVLDPTHPDIPATEYCIAAGGAGGIVATVHVGTSVEFTFDIPKPPFHETATLYILSTAPPTKGVGHIEGDHQYTTATGAHLVAGVPTFHTGEAIPVPSAVPEPGTFLLIGTGLACLLGQAVRRKLKA